MDAHAFQRLVEYAELDQKIDRLTQERLDLTKKIEKSTAQRNNLVETNLALCRSAHSLRKEFDLLELELRTLGQKLTLKETLLNSTGSVKEYTALQHEVESLSTERSSLEESGLTLLTRWEEAQRLCQRVLADEPGQLAVLDGEMQELVQRAEYVDALKSAYSSQKDKDTKVLDPELLAFYVSMKEKVPNPAVPLINGQCSACFYSVNPKDMQDIMQGNLVRCKNCYRFLYTHQPVKKNDI